MRTVKIRTDGCQYYKPHYKPTLIIALITEPTIELSNNAMKVLAHRDLLHHQDNVETPAALFRRVAEAVASAELKWNNQNFADQRQEDFFRMMATLSFLPNSPTLMNAGTPLNQLSACFVLPVEDGLADIFTTLKNAALIQQSGGGTGFNFSHLRPKDDPLTITSGTASGPLSFMKVFNAATEHIKHGGKRRGANMGILNIDHPDVEEFISAKKDDDSLRNFNISVGISDAFMEAVEASHEWALVHPKTTQVVKKISARKLWNSIVESAWLCGDPGLIFLDTINAGNPLLAIGKIECTNPCGEVPLFSYEACNLGSINLAAFHRNNNTIDWDQLAWTVASAVRFLDDVVEISNYVVPEIRQVVHQNRKIGLGVMGWADLLVLQGIPYDCEAALAFAERVMAFIREKALAASEVLAKERGPFPSWTRSSFYPGRPVRNATLLSIAPTGTISIIADASSSIEPLFALAYERKNVLDGSTLTEVNKYLVDELKEAGLFTPQLMEDITLQGNLHAIAFVPDDMKRVFKTAPEISPEWHLKHQAAFQRYVDNAVSKTINLPTSATVNDVADIYLSAWRKKLKGITVFRQHAKANQVLHTGITGEAIACKICAQ